MLSLTSPTKKTYLYTRLLSVLVLTTSLTPTAYAEEASFDCSKAVLVDEKIICSDSLLSRADFTLNASYTALKAGLPDQTQQEALRADQHNWLLLRNKECNVTRQTKVTDDNKANYVDCFLAAYDERAADLNTMKAQPDKAFSDISTPIRKSQFSQGDISQNSDKPLMETSIKVNGTPLLAWGNDGTLAVLGKTPGTATTHLYMWKQGTSAPTAIDAHVDTSDIQKICMAGKNVTLIRKSGSDAEPMAASVSSVSPVNWAVLKPELATTCRFDIHRQLVASSDGHNYIDLGAHQGNDDRFIKLYKDTSSVAINPPVRIDRRWALHGDYLAQDNSFAISVEASDAPPEILRRWAKNNCLPFWQVSALTGNATQSCIPYGSDGNSLARPLPTKAGLYFAIDSAGIYRTDATGTATKIVSGDITAATLSPDQCHIAFADSAVGSAERNIKVIETCKSVDKK